MPPAYPSLPAPASPRSAQHAGAYSAAPYALAAPARPRGEAACTIIISPMVSGVT